MDAILFFYYDFFSQPLPFLPVVAKWARAAFALGSNTLDGVNNFFLPAGLVAGGGGMGWLALTMFSFLACSLF